MGVDSMHISLSIVDGQAGRQIVYKRVVPNTWDQSLIDHQTDNI